MQRQQPNAEDAILDYYYKELNFFAEKVITSGGRNRIKYWEVFEKLHSTFEYKDVAWGRIHNLASLCCLVVAVTYAFERDGDDFGHEFGFGDDLLCNKPIVQWTSEDYDRIRKLLNEIANHITREDATRKISEGVNEENVHELVNDVDKYYDKLLRNISILRAVCPMQESFQTILDAECTLSDDDILPIDQRIIKDFRNKAKEEVDENIRECLLKLLQKEGADGNIQLVKVGRLRRLLKSDLFDLICFRRNVHVAVNAWFNMVFAREETDDNDNISRGELQDLAAEREIQKHRRHSHDRRGRRGEMSDSEDDDDFYSHEERRNRRVARAPYRSGGSKKRGRSGGGSRHSTTGSRERRKTDRRSGHTAHRYEMSQSEEDELVDSSDEGRRRREGGYDSLSNDSRPDFGLSDLPNSHRPSGAGKARKFPVKKSQIKMYDGRRPWSDAEKTAIKQGMKIYGKGEWAKIKEHYKEILGERTSGQISDCFRTMKSKGGFDDRVDDVEV